MRKNPPIDLVIADKSPLVLAGLKALVLHDVRFNLIATACDGERFLDAVRRFSFDVGVIGWKMPHGDGRMVLEALADLPEAPRIVVYTGDDEAATASQVMALGGAAFVSKSAAPEHLLDTVEAVAAGRMVFPFLDVRRLTGGDDPLATLSPRERELLEALGSGRTNAELARMLQVSINTVKFHLRNLFDKLAVRNRAQAVRLWHERRP